MSVLPSHRFLPQQAAPTGSSQGEHHLILAGKGVTEGEDAGFCLPLSLELTPTPGAPGVKDKSEGRLGWEVAPTHGSP